MDVTVITPTIKGREKQLAEALASVKAQTVPVLHMVELDDRGIGPGAVRNHMLRFVDTEYVAFLDDDDLLEPNHVEVLLSAIRKARADMAYSLCKVEGRDDWKPQHHCRFDERILTMNWIPVTWLARVDAIFEAGGFGENTVPPDHDDWHLLRNFHRQGKRVVCVHEFTWTYRFTKGSVSYA